MARLRGSGRRDLSAALLLLAACGSSPTFSISEGQAHRYAVARCAALDACCGAPEPQCVATHEQFLLDLGETFESSESCLRAVLEWAEQGIPCDGVTTFQSPACQLLHGELGIAERCETFGDLGFFGTDCAQGLTCSAGYCAEEPFVTLEAPLGGSCERPGWDCGPAGYCDPSGLCVPRAALGEPCRETSACADVGMNYCMLVGSDAVPPGVCAPRGRLGDLCASDDACGFVSQDGATEFLVCIDSRCQHQPPPSCDPIDAWDGA